MLTHAYTSAYSNTFFYEIPAWSLFRFFCSKIYFYAQWPVDMSILIIVSGDILATPFVFRSNLYLFPGNNYFRIFSFTIFINNEIVVCKCTFFDVINCISCACFWRQTTTERFQIICTSAFFFFFFNID